MPFPADGVDVLRRMTERQEEARRNAEEVRRSVYRDSEEEGSWLGTLGALLLLAILLFILGATGSTP
jgi:hypothetical protein